MKLSNYYCEIYSNNSMTVNTSKRLVLLHFELVLVQHNSYLNQTYVRVKREFRVFFFFYLCGLTVDSENSCVGVMHQALFSWLHALGGQLSQQCGFQSVWTLLFKSVWRSWVMQVRYLQISHGHGAMAVLGIAWIESGWVVQVSLCRAVRPFC